jgi:membrane protease YdiL (CAAX protease family)
MDSLRRRAADGDGVEPAVGESPNASDLGFRHVVWLVIAIALTDVLVTQLVPDAAELPVKAIIVAGFLWWARAGAGLSWTELGMGRAAVGSGLRTGLTVAAVIAVAIAVLVAIPASRSFFTGDDAVTGASATERWLKPLVLIPLGTVVFEETIFRGVLLGVLLRVTSTRRAVIASAVVFGCWHLPPAISNASGSSLIAGLGTVIGTIAVTSAAGVGFAILRVWSGSLIAPVCAHVATNSFAFVGALVAKRL